MVGLGVVGLVLLLLSFFVYIYICLCSGMSGGNDILNYLFGKHAMNVFLLSVPREGGGALRFYSSRRTKSSFLSILS